MNKDTRKREHVTPQRPPCSLTIKWAGRVDEVLVAQARSREFRSAPICSSRVRERLCLQTHSRELWRKTHSTVNSGVCTCAHIPSAHNTHHPTPAYETHKTSSCTENVTTLGIRARKCSCFRCKLQNHLGVCKEIGYISDLLN